MCGYNRFAVEGVGWIFPKVVFGATLVPKTTVGLAAGTSSMFSRRRFEEAFMMMRKELDLCQGGGNSIFARFVRAVLSSRSGL